MNSLKKDADYIIINSIAENMPQRAVENALKQHEFRKNTYLIAVGKAAWSMAKAAADFLGSKLLKGIVVTAYGHSKGSLKNIEIYYGGHPVSNENTINATKKCINLAKSLSEEDELLFLVSGGGSALFEKPIDGINLDDIIDITNQLLACGANIVEMNMIRKRLSQVKAGRFAQLVSPATIFTVMLSDVVGDRVDSIASGPAVPDKTTSEDAWKIVEKYSLTLTDEMKKCLDKETPKEITNVKTVVTGSVKFLCNSAAKNAKELGYNPYILTTKLNCEARDAGLFLASIAQDIQSGISSFQKPCAIIAGGETVVTLKGLGHGGRNQELALSAAKGIEGLNDTLIFSLGSDGTDGPTDAAGGMVDGKTAILLREKGFDIDEVLNRNDSYTALEAVEGLIITGPTGTNVNDVAVLLCR